MHATSNIALKVPFNEKDQAKALGARWNAEAKHWYVPQGVDDAPFEQWLTSRSAHASTPTQAHAPLKPTANISPNSDANTHAFNGDIDAINAELRNAFEPRDVEPF